MDVLATLLAQEAWPESVPSMAAVVAAIDALPLEARELARCRSVTVVPVSDHKVPHEIARKVRAKCGRLGAASVTNLREDGSVVVALGDLAHLAHELVHVGQVFAGSEAMEAVFRGVAAEGKLLLDRLKESGDLPRDLAWCASAIATTRGEGIFGDSEPGQDPHWGSWDLSQMLGVSDTLSAAAAGLGLPPESAKAVAFSALLLEEAGFTDFRGDVAREIVACRYAADLGPLHALFKDAVVCEKDSAPNRTIPKLADVAAALAACGDGATVVYRVAPRDADLAMLPRHDHPPIAVALAALAPAVRQPYGDGVARGRAGLHLFATVEGARDLVFGLEALAYRVMHLGDDGARALAALEEVRLEPDVDMVDSPSP